MLTFPSIDPVIFSVGPFAIRWYAVAYIAGIVIGWWLIGILNKDPRFQPPAFSRTAYDDVIIWAVLSIMLGGRIGYVLFYNSAYFFEHPLEIFKVWQGGMSFHGGLIGVILGYSIFCKKYGLEFFRVSDLLAVVTPIGLFFGRIANFINGELFGRVTDSEWGIVFPHGGPQPRHPSQLYEAALEGMFLFIILYSIARFTTARAKPGTLSGIFLLGYALSRMAIEQFREPDTQVGFLFETITMGQLLSAPMLLFGVYLIFRKQSA